MSNEGVLDPVVSGTRRVFCCHKARLSGIPVPNSLDAVAECAAANVPRLEIDVQFLADDSMLIYHDHMFERESTGTGRVSEFDRAGASAFRYRDERETPIAWLEDVVDLLRDCDSLLQIDLKLIAPFTPVRFESFLAAIQPLGERAIVGSQAHWNVRRLTGCGATLALDPTWQFNAFGPEEDMFGPARMGDFGLFDDSPLARFRRRITPEQYVQERIRDVRALFPEATEWMVDIGTIRQLSALGQPLGPILAAQGIALAAWTMHDEGPEVSTPLLRELFEAGATTIITDNALRISSYVTP